MGRPTLLRFIASLAIIAAVAAVTLPPSGAATAAYATRILRPGDRGSDVRELQQRLSALGYRLAADGVFGPATRQAVIAFQRRQGLVADGIVGAQTYRALNTAGPTRDAAVLDSPAATFVTHVVQRGEALFAIAARYGTTVTAIVEANGLRGTTIYAGQTLKVPVRGAGRQATGRHVVQAGDTLSGIGIRYGVTVEALKAANGLRSDIIYVGQTLSIPGTARIASAAPAQAAGAEAPAASVRHTVARGDTLWSISQQYGVPVERLREANGLRSDTIYIGQVLTIPGGQAAPDPYPDQPLAGKVIVVDAGHGGRDPGTYGVSSGVAESMITLDLARRVGDLLARAGATVVMTRDADVDVRDPQDPSAGPLQSRVNLANRAQAALFVSIHADWYDDPSVHGAATFYHPRRPQDATVARAIQQGLVQATGLANRGARPAGYYVLNHTTMPAVLVETGLLSSPADERRLLDPAFRQAVAEGLVAGIVQALR